MSMKLLAYIDGRPSSIKVLHFAAALKLRLGAELAVITVRAGTHATEVPPPLGVEIPLADFHRLPKGLQILTDAVRVLAEGGLLVSPRSILIQDVPHGHIFHCKTETGEHVPFYECFGHFIEALNHEIDKNEYHLLIIASPRRNGLRRILAPDTARQLSLDLHTSFLVVRGGGPDSRYLVCADGSPSSRRQFPLLKQLLPAIRRPVDIIWVKDPAAEPHQIHDAEECLGHASDWLESCGKKGILHRREGDRTADLIIEGAGGDSIVVMGASLRHDVYRRMMGSISMEVLSRTDSSVLVVKLPPEDDNEYFKEPFTCR
jgi:nucleotide-binding universal stress UspA family protein